jgi:sulfur carrier protein
VIEVLVNGEKRSIDTQAVLNDALQQWGYICEKIAVAINGEFVARGSYANVTLNANDTLDIVAPVQGG